MPLDEQRGLIDVALLTERATELGQAHLDLGVPADRVAPVDAELLAYEFGREAGDGHESVIGVRPRARPGDGRLEEVSEAVQLVPPLQGRPALALTVAAEHRVEVSVGLLRGGDPVDHAAEPLLEIAVGRGIRAPDLPRERLEVLVDLGVGELAPRRPAGSVPAAARSKLGSQPSDSRRDSMCVRVAEPFTVWRSPQNLR